MVTKGIGPALGKLIKALAFLWFKAGDLYDSDVDPQVLAGLTARIEQITAEVSALQTGPGLTEQYRLFPLEWIVPTG